MTSIYLTKVFLLQIFQQGFKEPCTRIWQLHRITNPPPTVEECWWLLKTRFGLLQIGQVGEKFFLNWEDTNMLCPTPQQPDGAYEIELNSISELLISLKNLKHLLTEFQTKIVVPANALINPITAGFPTAE